MKMRMQPLHLLILLLLIIEVSNSSKPNVVFIVIDDLRHLTDEDVLLPNLSNMAANGVYFENTFAQQALCAPSRNSLLTGRRPDALRLYDFYSYWRDTVGSFNTIPQYFKNNGYETLSVGKIFHPGKSSNFTDDYPYSWSHKPYHPPTDKFKDRAVCMDPKTKTLQRNLICPVRVKDQPGKSLPDLQTLDYAINVLKRRNRVPFFLAVGFHKPHIPFKYPQKYLGKVPISRVHAPKFPNVPKGLPMVAWHPWTDVKRRDDIAKLNISFPFGIMPHKWTLKIRQSYFAASLYIDAMLGALINYVDFENTVVVLTSDHGWSLGENGLWAKYSNFDVALKVPLLLIAPGLMPKSVQNPVESIDIFPTLLDLCGFSSNNIPKCKNSNDKSKLCFDGKSLLPLMKSNKDQNELKYNFAISQYPRPSVFPRYYSDKPRLKQIKIMGYTIRTKRYRYTEWISFNNTLFTRDWNKIFGLELYDHLIDPDETNNLCLNPKYNTTQQYLSKLLRSVV